MVCPPPHTQQPSQASLPNCRRFLGTLAAPAMMAITLKTMTLVCFFNTGISSVTLGSITALVLFCMLTGIMITIFERGQEANPHHREPGRGGGYHGVG